MSANFQIKEVEGNRFRSTELLLFLMFKGLCSLVHVIRSFLPEKCMKDEMNQQYELYSVAKTSLATIFMY